MTRINEREARCRVYTFKEGLLSAVAHDLEIDVKRFFVEWSDDASRLTAEMDASSLHVLHAVHDGRPAPSALSDRDRRKIEQTILEDVLHASRHPAIRFEASLTWAGGRPRLDGTLTLAGRSRSLPVSVSEDGRELVARATLHQPDFGITPYSAMLGTLKIKPDVKVEVRIPSSHRRAERAA
jgi:polyisoprenoid-binding protein YceI